MISRARFMARSCSNSPGTRSSCAAVLRSSSGGAVEDVQGVLTLFCSGAAQVCHALRVDELREQLEVEEEDRGQTGGTMDGGEMRSELEP